MRITFRPREPDPETSDRRRFVERCCVVLTERCAEVAHHDPPRDDPFPDLHLDGFLSTDRSRRRPTVLPPLVSLPAVIPVATRIQFLPHLIGDDRALEQLAAGAVIIGVGNVLRRNPELWAAARHPLGAMGFEGVEHPGPADD